MGLLSGILSAAAPIVGGVFGGPAGAAIGGALGGLLGSRDTPSSLTSTSSSQLDPRINSMLFGGNGQQGLLGQYQSMLQQPAGTQSYQQAGSDYLSNYGAADLGAIRGTATKLMQGQQAPSGGQLAWATGSNVQAPAQNNMSLTGSYDSLINGAAGANPFLTGAIQKGIDQSTSAFTNMQDSATRSLMRDVLPSIRSSSVLAGQYGGSRQGVAEGNVIGDYARSAQLAASQFGQNNTDAAVSAQAGAYDADRNRQLAATTSLSGQQYGVAQQNAANANQAEFMNVNNVADWNRQNLQSQLATNAQNNSAALGGAGLLGGLTSGAAGATNLDLTRAQGVNGLLAPYLGVNGSSISSQPLYQSTGGSILGGAFAGAGLANLMGGNSSSAGNNPGSLYELLTSKNPFAFG